MCGVAGYVLTDDVTPPPREVLSRMGDALAHRGPDDAGIWEGAGVGLAHRRLSIIDTSDAGHQPMISACGRFVIAYNGEIYNFRELRSDLEKRGVVFRTQCDTEVLLEGWAAWGIAVLQRLNGIFAFAIHDREDGRVCLVRDRLGVKPMHYTQRSGVLAFASELQALRAGDFTGTKLNAAAIDAYFAYLYIPAPDTIYDGVYKLRPGEVLIADRDGVRTERYWGIDYTIDSTWTLDSAAERFSELLTESVAMQQMSDVPLGAFLSGGIDSTAVVASVAASSLDTFTIGFDDATADERKYASRAANHLGSNHHEEVLSPDWADLLPTALRHLGEPFADSSALPMWAVSEMAREHVTVALSGDGGDELFAGYSWTHMNHRVAQYRRLPASLRRLVHAALQLAPESPKLGRLLRFSEDSFLGPDASFLRRLTCVRPANRAALFHPAVHRAMQGHAMDRLEAQLDHLSALAPDDRMLALDTHAYLPDDILTKVDRMSMAHGLEARVPLLDHRMVEFAASVPFSLKYLGGTSKRLMKHALRGRVPDTLLAQRKRGFSLPIHDWFRGAWAERFRETVLCPDARCANFLHTERCEDALNAHLAETEDRGHELWAMLVFEVWLRECDTDFSV